MEEKMNSNFNFLQNDYQALAKIGEMAEYTIYKDPNTSILKLRQFSEELINIISKMENINQDKVSKASEKFLNLKRDLVKSARYILHHLQKLIQKQMYGLLKI